MRRGVGTTLIMIFGGNGKFCHVDEMELTQAARPLISAKNIFHC
jgi:hypothetical protein